MTERIGVSKLSKIKLLQYIELRLNFIKIVKNVVKFYAFK